MPLVVAVSRSAVVSQIDDDSGANSEYQHLRPMLERADLKLGEIIYQADQRIDHVYVPDTAVVAMVDTVEDGATVEVGIIGHEGMVLSRTSLKCPTNPLRRCWGPAEKVLPRKP